MQEPNHEILPEQPLEQTPAEQLGLPTLVTIQRTSGEMESGWAIDEFRENYPHPETGEPVTAVKLSRLDPDSGNTYERAVTLDELQAWNATPDEDTRPKQIISTIESEQERPEDIAGPDDEPAVENIAELTGGLALSGLKIVMPGAENETAEQKGEENMAVQSWPTAGAVESAKGPRIEKSMAELREQWGLSETATIDEAVQRIDLEAEQVDGILQLLHGFDRVRGTTINQLHASLNDGKMALFGSNRKAIDELMNDRRFNELLGIVNNSDQEFLPPAIRSKLGKLSRGLSSLRSGFEDMNSRGPNFLNAEGAQKTMNALSQLPEAARLMTHARTLLEEMRSGLVGYQERASETDGAKIEYRNEQVAQWEAALKGELTSDQLEDITKDIESAVAREVGMVDDPNSPSRWFGNRVMNNDSKDRAKIEVTGRNATDVPSWRYVAENITDMLRGNFRTDLIPKSDSIVLDETSVSGVRVGQHRVAALAMLYGKDWQVVAKKLGFGVERAI